jgi:Flp pilus assembly protein TadB
MPPAMQHGRDFLRWFDDLSLITQSIVVFGVFMLLRGVLLWMKSRRQRRKAEIERARWQQEQWKREQQQRQQRETQEQNEKQRAHERTQKRRRKRYARDGNVETRGAAIINGAATVKATEATAHKDTRGD